LAILKTNGIQVLNGQFVINAFLFRRIVSATSDLQDQKSDVDQTCVQLSEQNLSLQTAVA
jgi:hypothetical protein